MALRIQSAISGGQGLELVRVVPNPYDKRSRLFQFGEDSQYDRITFYGLPAECRLMIFTERGDLIWDKTHTSGTGDELWVGNGLCAWQVPFCSQYNKRDYQTITNNAPG